MKLGSKRVQLLFLHLILLTAYTCSLSNTLENSENNTLSSEKIFEKERAPRPEAQQNGVVGTVLNPVFSNTFGGQGAGRGNVIGPSSSTPNAIAIYADDTGTKLANTQITIDPQNIFNVNNIELNGITKNSITVNWPSTSGTAGTFLGSDGAGNLIYAVPAGAGNVSTALPFSINNALITTDLPHGFDNIKQSNVTLDGSNNINGINSLSANIVQLQSGISSNSIGLDAPATVTASYTVSLPAVPPASGQVLQANSPTTLQWATIGGLSPSNEIYYVSLDGSDSNNGSFGAPFRTVSHAVSVANGVASISNPVAILIGVGLFFEDNTGGPITITADGISIIGTSAASTVIIPLSSAINLFHMTTANVELKELTLEMPFPGSTAAAVSLSANNINSLANMRSLIVSGFQTGFDVNSPLGIASIAFDNIESAGNSTLISINNMQIAVVKNSLIQGASEIGGTAANTGIVMTGTNTKMAILGTAFNLFDTAVLVTGGSSLRILGSDLEANTNGVVCEGGSIVDVVGCNFLLNNSASVNVTCSGAGSIVIIEGSNFDCGVGGVPQGIALSVISGASMAIDSCAIDSAVIGIQCGLPSDSNVTNLSASGAILANCITDVQQNGSSTLNFFSGVVDETKISINNPTNVSFAAFNRDAELVIGTGADIEHTVYQILNGESVEPVLEYNPHYYGNKGTVYVNVNGDPTVNATQASNNAASYYVVTGDRTQQASMNLISDSGNIGVGDNVRGWTVSKLGTSAELAFTYTNNDTSGQAARGSNTVVQFNGFDNQLEFPLATNTPLPTNTVAQLVWAGDTTLHRSAANTLQTDGNFVVGSLTPAGVVHNDNTGLLSTSLIVNADISASAGITDNKLATIVTPGKVANSATTATASNVANTIVLRDSTGSFTANTVTANNFIGNVTGNVTGDVIGNATSATNAVTAVDFIGSLTGDVIGTQGATIVSSVGGQSAVNIATGVALANTATSNNAPNTLVERNALGNFATNMITINGVVTNPTDVATKSYVDTAVSTGIVAKTPAEVVSTADVALSGLQTIDGVTLVDSNRVLLVAQTNPVENGLWLAHTSSWTRPVDFASTTSAGEAYVLILEGNVNAGSSWLCNTPSAIIDTDPIMFAEFSLPSQTTGANVGTGAGQVFRDKTGITLNFKTIAAGSHIVVTNDANDVMIATDGTTANTPSTLVARDPSGNFAANIVTAALNGNAATATSAVTAGSATTAVSFTGSLVGDVTGTQGATVVSTVGGQSAAAIGSAVSLVSSATSLNVPSTLVLRDASGSFAANIVTAALNGNAATATTAGSFSGSLSGDVTGGQSTTQVAFVGGQSAANVAAATIAANAATNTNTPNTIVKRDATGSFSAGTVTAAGFVGPLTGNVNGTATNAITAGSAGTVTGSFQGDVTGTQSAMVVSTVGGQTAANVAAATVLANNATSSNTASAIVRRDASGNFTSNIITATLNGNAATATSATTAGSATTAVNFTGSLVGDVTGTQGATVVSTVGGQSAAAIGSAVSLVSTATSLDVPSTLVLRDSNGSFAANIVTAALNGNAATATTAVNFSGSLAGDVTGPQGTTHVAFVGGQSAANVAAGTTAANAATNTNTANTIVERDGTGSFSAGTVTAAGFVGPLTGNVNGTATNAITAGSAGTVTGSFSGDVTGNQSAMVVSAVGGQTAANVAAATVLANNATSSNTASTIVRRDASGNFTSNIITATLNGNAATATSATTAGSATTAVNFTGSLVGDVTGTQGATVVSTVGGQSAAAIGSAVSLVSTATSLDVPSTLVLRDSNGSFAANIVTAALNGNAATATTAVNFSGSLAGDVTGGQSTTHVAFVGGQSAANVAAATTAANAATNTNTPNTIVKRDGTGSFSAGTISAATGFVGNLTGNVAGNATSATTAGSAGTVTGSFQGDVTGTQGAMVVSTVGGQTAANVAAATVLANNATSSNVASAIVRRDASGNFAANNITASLIGAASLNVLKSGDTMTGALTLPAGTVASPSLQFTGSTNTGLSAPSVNTLSMSTNGLQRLFIDTTGSITYKSNYKMYAYLSTTQNVNHTTATILFNTVLLDPNSNYNASTGTYTVPVTGTYMVNVGVVSTSNGSSETVNVYRNGTAVTGASVSQTATGGLFPITTATLLQFTAGDSIQIRFTTNGNETVQANDTHLAIHFMSF